MSSVAILGCGRLGICTALVLEKAGHTVYCYDVAAPIMDAIESKTILSPEKGVAEMLSASTNLNACRVLEDCMDQSLFFCVVPTPSLPDGSYSHRYIDTLVESFLHLLPRYPGKKLFTVCSTTMPGYCDALQERFTTNGFDVEVCYNPEFIAQGDILHGLYSPDIVLIGEASTESGMILESIYRTFVTSSPTMCRMTRKEAEITKIAINCFITTKISFANTIGDLCIQSNCNQDRVLNAIGGDSRIGSRYFRWGYGFGGPCFPRDNRALCHFARENAVINLIGEATDAVNQKHLQFLLSKLIALKGTRDFVFTDLAYKPGTVILEESQSLQLALGLARHGHTVYIQESECIVATLQNEYPSIFKYGTPTDTESFVVTHALTMFRV